MPTDIRPGRAFDTPCEESLERALSQMLILPQGILQNVSTHAKRRPHVIIDGL